MIMPSVTGQTREVSKPTPEPVEPETLICALLTLHPKAQTLNPEPCTLNPKSHAIHPQPYIINPKPYTINPKP